MSSTTKTNVLILSVAVPALVTIKLRLPSILLGICNITAANNYFTFATLAVIWSFTMHYGYRWKDDNSTMAVVATYFHASIWSLLVLLNAYLFVGLIS